MRDGDFPSSGGTKAFLPIFMNKPLFAHRPPSVGVHLLNDPLPELIAHSFLERTKRAGAGSAAKPPLTKPKKSDSGS